MIPAVKRGDAVAVSAGGEPPALFTSTSSRAEALDAVAAITASTWSGSRTSAATNSHAVGKSSGSWRQQTSDVRAGLGEALRDARARCPRHPPVTSTTWPSKRRSSIGRAFWHSRAAECTI